MDAKVEQPPKKRKKKMNTTTPPPPSFSSLPDDILVNCLARTSRSHYRSLSLVSKSIRSLISAPELYATRSRIGNTEPCLYICQRLPTYDRWYTLDQTLIISGRIEDESSLSPIRPSSSAPPKSSTTVSVGFEIYQMGGTINNDKQPSTAVRVLDCRTHKWRDAPNMTVARKGAHSAFIDGKIFVIGGTEKSMNWGEVFDLNTQSWKPIPNLNVTAKAQFYKGKLYARSEHKRYAYDSKEGRWKQVCFCRERKRRPWCVIENVMFRLSYSEFKSLVRFRWYDSERRKWFTVQGLKGLYKKSVLLESKTVQLANFCGKLVILWYQRPVHAGGKKSRNKNACRIWCAVVRFKKRIGFSGLEIWGKIERLNSVLTILNSYKLLSCINL